MNIATDLIERDHEEIAEGISDFETRPHRSRALDLCTVVERHCRMEREVLEPVLAAMEPGETDGRVDRLAEVADEVRHASDRDELRRVVAELSGSLRDHRTDDLERVLPAMESELGVARMNELGIELLDWQHRTAREQRESDEELSDLLELTRAELYEKARDADLDGRSTMRKVELAEALANS